MKSKMENGLVGNSMLVIFCWDLNLCDDWDIVHLNFNLEDDLYVVNSIIINVLIF